MILGFTLPGFSTPAPASVGRPDLGPLRLFLDSVPEQACVLDRAGRILFVNRAWTAFAEANGFVGTKFEGGGFEGRSYLETCQATVGTEQAMAGAFADGLRDVIDGRAATFEKTFPCHAPDRRRWFKASVSTYGCLVVVRHIDVTADHEAVPSHLLAERDAVFAHELRTPLTVILGYEELCAEALDDRDDAGLRRHLASIRSGARAIKHIMDNMLAAGQAAHAASRLDEQAFDLAALVQSVCQFHAQAGRSVSLETRLRDGGGLAFLADRFKLERIVANLVSNAIKYNKAGGAVTVTLERNVARGEVLTVRDTGRGMSAAELARIGEAYARGDGVAAAGIAGTGIGLSLVRHFVDLHEARLEIDSAAGVGTTVTVTFPSWRTVPQTAAGAAAETP